MLGAQCHHIININKINVLGAQCHHIMNNINNIVWTEKNNTVAQLAPEIG